MARPDMNADNAPTPFDIPAETLAEVASDATRGVVYLHGLEGGLSLIVGEIAPSSVMEGMLAVETEHGTLYLDVDEPVSIVEA